MASARTPKWRMILQRIAPWLFRRCLGQNLHWRWQRNCGCVRGENGRGVQLRVWGNFWVDLGDTEHAPQTDEEAWEQVEHSRVEEAVKRVFDHEHTMVHVDRGSDEKLCTHPKCGHRTGA